MKAQTTKVIKKDAADYINRPLDEEEKEFAADLENYDHFFGYMRFHKLDPEEWYDILIEHYLRAVKKYISMPGLQEYRFSTILYKTLDSARLHHYEAMNRKKRKPEGGLVSLDLVLEDDRGRERQIEAWMIDKNASVERQVIFKELFKEFYMQCITGDVAETWEDGINGYLKAELDLLLEGYSLYQVNKRTEKQYPFGYDMESLQRDIVDFRQIFRKVFGI